MEKTLEIINRMQADGIIGNYAIGGAVGTWVMTAEHLIAIALKLGRKKDEARVERFVEIGKYDPAKLEEILRRHNLIDKWKKISDGWPGGKHE